MFQLMQFLDLQCEKFCIKDQYKVYLYMHEEEDG